MQESLHKWRLILGAEENDGTGITLNELESKIDATLNALYDSERKGGLGASSPNVARWLGDIRAFFPVAVVKIMQQDALHRLQLQRMLLEKEMLESVEPDIHLVATLMTLSKIIPEKTRATARQVVQKLVEELLQKWTGPTLQAITGAVSRCGRTLRPRYRDIDWHSTIRKNLKHYQPPYRTIIPETMIGFGRKRRSLKEVVLCIDQSGSMGSSVIYSSIFGSVMASIPALQMRMVVFDTAVADLTEELSDPVDLLFGVQLGGGTDIKKALTYCNQIITRPADTILVLISDLFEGGAAEEMLALAASLIQSGVQLIVLLALNDEGTPSYDHHNAEKLGALGIPVFGCTPQRFPDLMAAAIAKQDLILWAHENKGND